MRRYRANNRLDGEPINRANRQASAVRGCCGLHAGLDRDPLVVGTHSPSNGMPTGRHVPEEDRTEIVTRLHGQRIGEPTTMR